MVVPAGMLVNSTGQDISEFIRSGKQLATSLYLEQRNSVLIQTNYVLVAFLLLRSAYEKPSLRPPLPPSVHIYVTRNPLAE
jgi:hypothetical protein